jgi:hypothetical protein
MTNRQDHISRILGSSLDQAEQAQEIAKAPLITPDIIQHLERVFPVIPIQQVGAGLDGAVNTALMCAREAGRIEIIQHLRNLMNTQRGS